MISQDDYQEVLKMRWEFAALRADFMRTVRDWYARKYSPDQPRVPAGSREGGQWTDGNGGGGINDSRVISDATPNNDWKPGAQYAASQKRSEAYCWNQLTIDNLRCSAAFPVPRRAACRRQAMERYANCLTGKDLPLLNF